MRRMLREVPNCELTHAEHGCDDHSRGWRTYVAVICDYIMVSPVPSRGQRQHGGREISFVSRRAALRRAASPPVDAERRRRCRFLARRPYDNPRRRRAARRVSHGSSRLALRMYFVTGTRLDIAHRSLDTHERATLSGGPPRISRAISVCRHGISR